MTYRFYQRMLLWGLVFLCSLFLNEFASGVLVSLYQEGTAVVLAYVCSFFFIILLFAIAVETVVWHNRKQFILPFILSFVVAMWLGMLLKNIVALDRPFHIYSFPALVMEPGYSFPSLHAIAAFSLLPIVWYKNRGVATFWLFFALLISFSRLYLQVHFLSDVVAGACIGFEVASFFIYLEQKYKLFSKLNRLFVTTLEMRRQVFHLLFGCSIVFLYKVYLLTTDILFFGIILLIVCIILLKRYRRPFFLYKALAFFEREKHLSRFPARGILFFTIGSFLSFLFYSDSIALASIMVLAFGDSITNVVGRYFGKYKIWYNPKKHWEGTIAGVFFATIGASFFLPLWIAFCSALVALLIESLDVSFGQFEIDDNVTIPLIAGGVASFLLLV